MTRWPARTLVALVVCVLALTGLVGVPGAFAVGTADSVLTVASEATGPADQPHDVRVALSAADASPIAGATVSLQRNLGSGWTDTAVSGSTGADGLVTLQLPLTKGSQEVRAVFAGDDTYAPKESAPVTVVGTLTSTLTLTGPGPAAATTVPLTLSWTAADDTPITGSVTVFRKLGTAPWLPYGTFATTDGQLVLDVPRVDASWRATGAAEAWWLGADSGTLDLRDQPATAPVFLPALAPRPAYTPPQARAVGPGAYPVITAVPWDVWRSMVGRSWHRGCPVGRRGLRLLRINYWGFDGLRYRGEMVLNAAVVYRAAGALRTMYDRRLPIRRMYRVDRFGWSRRLHGANDYASMRADNTSAFNCRSVVNRPSRRSPHSTGRSVDLNTWENPYRSATGWVPNTWWAWRSHPLVAWRSTYHPVVQIWRAWGFRWTYGAGDSQHVDGRTPPPAGTFTG